MTGALLDLRQRWLTRIDADLAGAFVLRRTVLQLDGNVRAPWFRVTAASGIAVRDAPSQLAQVIGGLPEGALFQAGTPSSLSLGIRLFLTSILILTADNEVPVEDGCAVQTKLGWVGPLEGLATSLSPAASSRRRAPAREELTDWACSVCTLINAPMATACSVCDTPRPGGEVTSWECPQCTYQNGLAVDTCEICSAPKPGGLPVGTASVEVRGACTSRECGLRAIGETCKQFVPHRHSAMCSFCGCIDASHELHRTERSLFLQAACRLFHSAGHSLFRSFLGDALQLLAALVHAKLTGGSRDLCVHLAVRVQQLLDNRHALESAAATRTRLEALARLGVLARDKARLHALLTEVRFLNCLCFSFMF